MVSENKYATENFFSLSICPIHILAVQASILVLKKAFFYLRYLLSIVLTIYLKKRDPNNPNMWSYVDFLILNRATIINLPKWTSPEGTWTRRFLQEAKELDPASADTLKALDGVEASRARQP